MIAPSLITMSIAGVIKPSFLLAKSKYRRPTQYDSTEFHHGQGQPGEFTELLKNATRAAIIINSYVATKKVDLRPIPPLGSDESKPLVRAHRNEQHGCHFPSDENKAAPSSANVHSAAS